MNEALPYIFTVVLVILTIIISIVGVQLIIILSHVKKTFQKLNGVLDNAEHKFSNLIEPLQNLKGLTSSLTAGVEIGKTVMEWFIKKKQDGKSK
jgi:hypothetical protein